jgi:hypothetical protein
MDQMNRLSEDPRDHLSKNQPEIDPREHLPKHKAKRKHKAFHKGDEFGLAWRAGIMSSQTLHLLLKTSTHKSLFEPADPTKFHQHDNIHSA